MAPAGTACGGWRGLPGHAAAAAARPGGSGAPARRAGRGAGAGPVPARCQPGPGSPRWSAPVPPLRPKAPRPTAGAVPAVQRRGGSGRARPCAGIPPGCAAPGTPPGAGCTELRGAAKELRSTAAARRLLARPLRTCGGGAGPCPALPCPGGGPASRKPDLPHPCRRAGRAVRACWAPPQQRHAAPGRAPPPPSAAPRPPHGECRRPRTCPVSRPSRGRPVRAGRREPQPVSGGGLGARGRLSEPAPGCRAWPAPPPSPQGHAALLSWGTPSPHIQVLSFLRWVTINF